MVLTWKKLPNAHSFAARSRSASSSTMALFLPPSSIRHGLSAFPQIDDRMDPTIVLPVKFIFLICGCSIIALVITGASEGG